MKLVDKMKKLKGSLYLRSSKELTEDKGEAPEEHTVVDEESGRVVASFVKKDGEILESAATQDAQDSGDFETATKKVGGKKDDIQYTSPSMAAAKAFTEEKKESKDKKNERVLGEKTKLVKAVQSPGSMKDSFPKSHAALELDGDYNNPDVANHHAKLHIQMAAKASDPASRMYHHAQAAKINKKIGELDKSDCLAKDLNYSDMNKIETQKNPHTIDYSKLKQPDQAPKWKQRRDDQLRQQRQQTLERIRSTVAKKPLNKSEPLKKDVKSIDEFRQRYQKLKEKTSKPGMTRDQKIKAALAAQADTNPFATDRSEQVSQKEDRGPVDAKFKAALERQANKGRTSSQEDKEERAFNAQRTLNERGIEKRERDQERMADPIFEQTHGQEMLAHHQKHRDLSRGGHKEDFRVIDNKRIAYHGKDGDNHYFSVSGKDGARPHRFVAKKDEKGRLDIKHIPRPPFIWDGADEAGAAIEYAGDMKLASATRGVPPAKMALKKHPILAPKESAGATPEEPKKESRFLRVVEPAGKSEDLKKTVHPRPGLGITQIKELMRRWKGGR